MIADANTSIQRANQEALSRRNAAASGRRPIKLLDHWLNQVETLVERNDSPVPEPLIGEIARFMGKFDPRLYRRLRRHGPRKASRVLDLLFEAEELFLPKTADTD
jgi:hypothetical protein